MQWESPGDLADTGLSRLTLEQRELLQRRHWSSVLLPTPHADLHVDELAVHVILRMDLSLSPCLTDTKTLTNRTPASIEHDDYPVYICELHSVATPSLPDIATHGGIPLGACCSMALTKQHVLCYAQIQRYTSAEPALATTTSISTTYWPRLRHMRHTTSASCILCDLLPR